MGKMLIISSDGHATAQMPDYRPYLDVRFHQQFDEFCAVYKVKGSRNFDPPALLIRTDPEVVEAWEHDVVRAGRLDGNWHPERRLKELEAQGVAAEVLFPDFGLPFELHSPALAAALGEPPRPQDLLDASNTAYNRWLADFCRSAPERFAGMAAVSFNDVDEAIIEIKRVREDGLRGVVLPMFDPNVGLFDDRYEPIWSLLEDLDMPVNCHVAMSGITNTLAIPSLPHPACAQPIFTWQMLYSAHGVLSHMIWGGVLERHPKLRVVFTEQGGGWVIDFLRHADHTYERSFLRRDIREVVPSRPSDYFRRQCFIGASLLSRNEAAARNEIGVDKIMFGVDYPHHEGTWGVGEGTQEYLRATLGAAKVNEGDARLMLGLNALALWDLDPSALQAIADRVGPDPEHILHPSTEGKYERGDVCRPLTALM